jgi:hypothetical protein
MPTYDARTAECLIYTFKDGLFAKLAHDLKLRVELLNITRDETGTAVSATVDTRSVHVVGFRKDDQDDPRPLGAFERSQIEGNLHRDVLDSARFPEARFVSTAVTGSGATFTVRGLLTLHGRSIELTIPVRRVEDGYRAMFTLEQSRFGIKPYSAALGALKVRNEVTVIVTVPAA